MDYLFYHKKIRCVLLFPLQKSVHTKLWKRLSTEKCHSFPFCFHRSKSLWTFIFTKSLFRATLHHFNFEKRFFKLETSKIKSVLCAFPYRKEKSSYQTMEKAFHEKGKRKKFHLLLFIPVIKWLYKLALIFNAMVGLGSYLFIYVSICSFNSKILCWSDLCSLIHKK